MTDQLNVFEHQRFRLRTPEGEPVQKSFRELLTEPDSAYALDYAQAFYDVAALSLMSYLAQVAFEPESVEELADRIAEPMSEDDFERAIAPLRVQFALTGDGPRFMQAPEPFDEKKATGLDVAVFISAKGDRQFLHRADADWVVTPEQAGLFLFARNTFYEGTGGRGYQKGTNGDTPVRVLVTDAADGATLWLRRTIWLNVLACEQQREYAGAYANPRELREGEYDGAFWVDLPPEDVPTGSITLRAGLGWMTAYHWLWFEDGEGICPLTGERVEGFVARSASKRSTGIAYGSKGDMESGVRAERLFRHPNVAARKRYDKTGDVTGEDPFLVQRTEGLTEAVGAAFFGGTSQQDAAAFVLAPVVSQVQHPALKRAFARVGRLPTAMVFGFHMLSSQRNVHGGIEKNSFALPLVGANAFETKRLMETGSQLLRDASAFAEQAARILGQAVQRTAGAGVRAQEDPDTGRITLKKLESTPSVDDPFGRDTLAAYWRAIQRNLVSHAGSIAATAEDGPDALTLRSDELRSKWEDIVVSEVRNQYAPVFEHYSTLPRTMPYAHAALRILTGTLKKLRSTQPETA